MNYQDEGTAPAQDNERVDVGGMAPEEMPSLADFFEEPAGGAWPNAWYAASIVEGYTTGNGKVWSTEDTQSRGGDSRNLRICFNVNGGKLGFRNTFASLNYRSEDFTADRLSAVKSAREQHKGEKAGKWVGQEDIQRSSLALGQLAQIENALGFKLKLHPNGHILPGTFVGQNMDVRFTTDDKGYNTINAFAKAGSKAKTK
jgi:hypothetical protein